MTFDLGVLGLREPQLVMNNSGSQPLWRALKRNRLASAPADLHPWLVDGDSLTKRLVACCGNAFSVKLLSQRRARASVDEARLLSMREGEGAVVRQVYLCCGNRPVVFARTVIPLSTMVGDLRRLCYLGNRPLGAVLFSDKTMRRGGMEIARLKMGDGLYCQAIASLDEPPLEIWGRRSLFYLSDKPLLVSEFFLPEVTRLGVGAMDGSLR